MNEEYIQFLYARAIEVQPQLGQLVQDFKSMSMDEEQIAIELAFAMLHEGYRIRYLEETNITNTEKTIDKTNSA